jgi:hypothetical protein
LSVLPAVGQAVLLVCIVLESEKARVAPPIVSNEKRGFVNGRELKPSRCFGSLSHHTLPPPPHRSPNAEQKAATIAPRPVAGAVRPVVRCPTFK